MLKQLPYMKYSYNYYIILFLFNFYIREAIFLCIIVRMFEQYKNENVLFYCLKQHTQGGGPNIS